MGISRGLLRLGLAVALLLLSACATEGPQAQTPQGGAQPTARGSERETPAQILSRHEPGASFQSEGETYVILQDARAVSRGALQSSVVSALSDVGATPGQVLGTKGRYVMYRDTGIAPYAPSPMVQAVNAQPVYSVVLNQRTGQYAVVTGTLTVKLRDMATADAVAQSHGLSVEVLFGHLGYAVYLAGPGHDLLTLADALRADERTASVTINVLENVAEPH